MTLEQYLITLLKRWKLMVICIVLLGVGAFVGSRLMTPLYQSTALVQIAFSSGTNQSDYTSLLAGNQLVQTEVILATTDPVLRKVASRYPGLTAEELSNEMTATPKTNTQLFEIDVLDPSPTRAAALANDIANTLIQQQVQLQQQASAQTGSFLFIAQPAQPSLKPARPNVPLYTAAGLLAGLLLGMSLALLFEQLDTRVRTPEALTQLLGWPVLATILQAGPKEEVVNPTGRNANVEPYRILRTNIGFSAIDKPLRTILVTSAMPRDGKSVVAANLAVFMAKAGKNTLLIDADLRRPTQHEHFGLPAQAMGLSNAILAFSMSATANAPAYEQALTPTMSTAPSSTSAVTRTPSLDPFVHAVDIPNLCVMPSGPLPPNPPELLDSKALLRFFAALASCGIEVVILDSPPLLGLSDASILASKVDGTLVVADITRANKGSLKQVKAMLEQAGAGVIGCVVNKQRRSRNEAIYSYYYLGADEQNNRSNRSTKNAKATSISTVTPDASKQPKTEPQQDLLDSAVKLAPVHPTKADTQSHPDLSDMNTVKTASVYPRQPGIQSRPDLLDGRKGG